LKYFLGYEPALFLSVNVFLQTFLNDRGNDEVGVSTSFSSMEECFKRNASKGNSTLTNNLFRVVPYLAVFTYEGKIEEERNLVIFEYSLIHIATWLESSRRDHFIDIVVRFIFESNQIMLFPVLPSYPEHVKEYLKQIFFCRGLWSL